jgi:hypothetical protein
VKPKPRNPRTEIEILDQYILDLTVRQIGANFNEFEALHVQIMDLQEKRRKLGGKDVLPLQSE